MATAYVDTSCAVAIALGEPTAGELSKRLGGFEELVSSNLLEAELLATLAREHIDPNATQELGELSWIIPDRQLSPEIARVLEAGYISGADCWHLATALHFSPDASELTFLTLDKRQKTVAETLGFRV